MDRRPGCACLDDWKLEGWPAVNLNPTVGRENHATNGAPLVPRQIEPWQFVSWKGVASLR